jgi:hypothetical protein
MAFDGYREYQRREFCRDVQCRVQLDLQKQQEGSAEYEKIRGICKSACIYTTYQFHHWLIEHGYLLLRPEQG